MVFKKSLVKITKLNFLWKGFSAKHKVIVLAATNRANVLDEALLRPGRLDRVVMVPPPDVRGREELFKKYLTPLHLDVSLTKEQLAKALAILTPQFTGNILVINYECLLKM